MIRNHIFSALFIFPNLSAARDKWITELPEHCLHNLNMPRISDVDLMEVPKSRFYVAENRLENSEYIDLHEMLARYYLGDFYSKPESKTPFLVRAVYSNGGTGKFNAYWCGNDLVIGHSSLGKSWREERSVLVINLAKKPEKVFVTMSMAE